MSDLKQSRSYRAVSLYVRGLRGARFLVIALWLATLVCGVKWAFTLLDKVTDGSDDLPKWEPSIVAAEVNTRTHCPNHVLRMWLSTACPDKCNFSHHPDLLH